MLDIIRLTDFLKQSDEEIIERVKAVAPKLKEYLLENSLNTSLAWTENSGNGICRILRLLNSSSDGKLIKKRDTNLATSLIGNTTLLVLEFSHIKLSGLSKILEIYIDIDTIDENGYGVSILYRNPYS